MGHKMTILMDKFFIKIGFEPQDLKACNIRGALYIGMIYTMGMSSAFAIMTILA